MPAPLPRTLALAAATLLAACGGGDDAGAGAGAAAAATSASATPRGAGAGGGGTGGGRPAPSIVLAPGDLHTVAAGPIESAIAVSGDLRPIERVSIRARGDGDVVALLAREGQRVRAGDVLARIEASQQEGELKAAEADRTAAQADVAAATWNLDQSRELFRAGAIAERDLKAQEQGAAAARARLAAAEARVRAAELVVRDTRLASPMDGTVESRRVEAGERVSRQQELFTVVRNDRLELVAALPARRAGEVAPGQPVRFSADGRDLTGTVARVSPTIDPASRSVTVYLQVPNPGGALKGNTFATGRVVGRVVRNAILIPLAAIRQPARPDDPPFAYTVVKDAIAVSPLRLGLVDDVGGVAQVLDGLATGDVVIVGNVGTLGRGMKVQVVGGDKGDRNARGGGAAKEVVPAK